MYRSRRVNIVRHALSVTLLGWASLAHATTPKTGDEQWTRVDLDNAPALVIGAAPGSSKSAKASASRSKKTAPHRKGTVPEGETPTLGKLDVKASENEAPASTPAVVKPVSPEVAQLDKQTPRAEPAQVAKASEPSAKPVEPAQLAKVVAPAVAAPLPTDTKAKPAAAAVPVPHSPVSALAALVAPALQLLPKTETPAEVKSAATPVEPAQLAPAAKKSEPAPEVTKPAATFALSPKDKTIRAGLERWTAKAGWKLSWELDEKNENGGVVRFDADFGADFDVALSKLAGAMRSEAKVHAYLYVGNKVLRIMEEPAKSVVQPAVPMTPLIPDGAQRDVGDRGLPYVTRIKGYWLGASGTESENAPPQSLPPVFNASVSLLFSESANLGTVTGILSKVTGIAILLPGAIEYPASSLFVNEAGATNKKKSAGSKGKHTYVGTPRALLDRISVSTGMLWEYKDETIVFTD
jgi:hypothetical protein